MMLFPGIVGVLGIVCSCADQTPDRASTAAPSTVRPAPSAATRKTDHAVLVHVKLSDDRFGIENERRRIAGLEDALSQAVTSAGVGEHDGNEVGGGEYTLYAYGPDAQRLAAAMRPILLKANLPRGSYMTIRAGPPGSPEKREDVASAVQKLAPGPAAVRTTAGSPSRSADVGDKVDLSDTAIVPKGFDEGLLQILACPEDKTPVRLATRRQLDDINTKIQRGSVRLRDVSARSKPVEALLIRQDGKLGCEIESGVPVMLIDRAIVLP
jgi:uncharacterized protein YbaR (Trm112 family)